MRDEEKGKEQKKRRRGNAEEARSKPAGNSDWVLSELAPLLHLFQPPPYLPPLILSPPLAVASQPLWLPVKGSIPYARITFPHLLVCHPAPILHRQKSRLRHPRRYLEALLATCSRTWTTQTTSSHPRRCQIGFAIL